MSLLIALLAQLLHGLLLLAAAPWLIGLRHAADAVLAGRAPPSPSQAWRDLRRLAHKQAVLAESASVLSTTAPPVCFAATAVAGLLVPSFTLGMAFAPWADLLAIAGLLTVARISLALAALDPGTALPGTAVQRLATSGWIAEPALLLAILALGLLGGTTNLDLLVGLQLQGMLQPVTAVALTASALVLLALAAPDTAALRAEFSGIDLALVEATEALRLLVWLDLLGALFLPFGMAEPAAGLLGWIVGLLAWGLRVILLTLLLAGIQRLCGALPPRRRPQAMQAAAGLSLVAALLVLASTVAQ